MLSVFICEDNVAQRERLEKIIANYIIIEEFDMTLVLSTDNPYNVLTYLTENPDTRGVYFLDVDLGHDINGIQLGSAIREKDIDGKIIFVTTHSELLVLTFTYKVEAMDYIIKDDTDELQRRIYETLLQAQKHYHAPHKQEEDRIKLTIGNQIRVFPIDDVMFIETSPTPHKLVLHLAHSSIEFYGKIADMPKLSNTLVNSHKSYVVNTKNIVTIDKTNRKIFMKNGEYCLFSARKLKQIEATLKMKK